PGISARRSGLAALRGAARTSAPELQPQVASRRLTCYRWLQMWSADSVGDSRRRAERERMLMAGLLIDRDVLIEAPVEVVWRTITEPELMTKWFADRVDLVVEPGAHGYMALGRPACTARLE